MNISTLRYIFRTFVALVVATNFIMLAFADDAIVVEITNFEFKPAKINVEPGDTVVFKNLDIVPHTATASDASWDTGNIASGQTQSLNILENMTLDFYCFYHQAMKGKLDYVQ